MNAAAVLVLGPYWGALASAAGIGVANLLQELALDVTLFNAAQMALAAGLAGHVWVAARPEGAGGLELPEDAPAFLLFTLVYLAVNAGLVTASISLAHGVPFRKTLAANVRWAVPNMLLLGAMGLLMAALYESGLGAGGVALSWIPLLLARYAFCQYLELQRVYLETVQALVAALEARDPLTCGHSQRVSDYAVAVARAMKLAPEQVEAVRYAGLLHDIGKIGIQDSILNKVGRLTDEEYGVVKRHPVIGAEMLGKVSFLAEVSRLIRSHHERYDGLGYPDGLRGEAIPLGSRILAVVDAFDVMVTGRPYKPAMDLEEAIGELERGKGTQFDPQVVDVFVGWLRAGGDLVAAGAALAGSRVVGVR